MSRLLSVLLAAAGAAAPQPAGLEPIHRDSAAVEKGMLDATKAVLYGDSAAARAALDRVEAGCRRVGYDEVPPWPREMVDQDVGMHAALTRAREYASRSMWEDVANSLVWVGRSCRNCHTLRATTASPSDSGSPTPKSGSTP
jgi:hypothetical protein